MKKNKGQFPANQMLKDESENKNKLKNRQRTQPKFT
jgi:hypothetical protein